MENANSHQCNIHYEVQMKAISFIVEAPTLYRHSRSTN